MWTQPAPDEADFTILMAVTSNKTPANHRPACRLYRRTRKRAGIKVFANFHYPRRRVQYEVVCRGLCGRGLEVARGKSRLSLSNALG